MLDARDLTRGLVWLRTAEQQPSGPCPHVGHCIADGTSLPTHPSSHPQAEAQIEKYTRMGFDKLPICMAKTQYSFSHDASLKGEGGWGGGIGAWGGIGLRCWAGVRELVQGAGLKTLPNCRCGLGGLLSHMPPQRAGKVRREHLLHGGRRPG